MTRSRATRALLTAGGLSFAALWAWAGTVLWDTTVPGDLALPDLAAADFFGARALERARDYERLAAILVAAGALAQVVVLGLYARGGGRFARESAAGPIGTGMLLGMLGFAFVWFAQVPFGLTALWWARRHDLTEVGYPDWLLQDWLGVGGKFVFVCLALLVVMGLARLLGRRWWLAGGPALAAIGLGFAFVAPYLIPDQEPLRDPALARDARDLARRQGVPGVGVRVQAVKEETTAPNAAAVGLGATRRVILWDTLADGFPRREVRAVLSHEFGHHSEDHLWKLFAWQALLALPLALLIERGTRRRGGLREPGAVPLAIFLLVVLQLVTLPLQSALSRRYEAEADWAALQTTRDPAAVQRLFARFTDRALADPSPPAWEQFVFAGHPSLLDRIAMAEAWKRRTGVDTGPPPAP